MESDKKSSIRQKMEPNGSIFCRFLVTRIKEKKLLLESISEQYEFARSHCQL